MTNDHVTHAEQRRHDHQPALGAIFTSREEAKHALGALHRAHFTKSWFGTTSVATDARGEPALTAETAGAFFSQSSMGLVDALVAHGIEGAAARTFASQVEPGNAIVTVEPGDRDPAEASAILQQHGGRIEGGRGSATGGDSVRVPTLSDEVDDAVWEEEVFYWRTPR